MGKITTNTQVSKKFQTKPKYELEYKQVNDLISIQIDPPHHNQTPLEQHLVDTCNI
jgi:hypothetical protein